MLAASLGDGLAGAAKHLNKQASGMQQAIGGALAGQMDAYSAGEKYSQAGCSSGVPARSSLAKIVGVKAAPQLTTLLFVVMWYGLNVAFNLLNKSIFNYFPFPYTVSAVHVVVGLLYCSVAYLVGAKKASFGRVC